MFTLLLSLLIATAQVVFCPHPGCRFLAAEAAAAGSDRSHQAAPGTPSLDGALAFMGHAAIEAAFSGVVRVGDGPVADSRGTRDC